MREFGRFLRQNTIALLALFVALGGTTFAAATVVLPANSVGAKQLKRNAVINTKIKNNAVTGAKIANDTIKGADVLESSLGKVPSASSADNATHATAADSATNATHATNATNATNATSATSATNAANATNANALNQYAANGLTRVARMGTQATLILTADFETFGTALSITAPAAGFVMITGGATIRNNPSAGCTFHCDAFGLIRHIQTGNETFVSETSLNSQVYSTIAWGDAFPVNAGVNTFDIRLQRSMDGSPGEGELDGWFANLGAVYSPFGSTGGATLGPGGASPSGLKAH